MKQPDQDTTFNNLPVKIENKTKEAGMKIPALCVILAPENAAHNPSDATHDGVRALFSALKI